jgi:uncharacterized phage-associated protein
MESIKNLGKVNAQMLADYILQKYGPMSHLKLQKLLYYCESYHLAYFDDNLIPEEFEAWVHGPVCREVYDSLKDSSVLYVDLGFAGTNNPEAELNNLLSSDQSQLIIDVLNELSAWTGLELENATHSELPWCEARQGLGPADRCEKIISKNTM